MKMKKMRDQYVTLLLKVLKLQLQTTHRAASWKEGGASAVDMIFSFFPFSLQMFNLYLLIKSQSPWDQFISPKRIRNNILFFLALERIIIRQLLYAPRFFLCTPKFKMFTPYPSPPHLSPTLFSSPSSPSSS